MIPSTLVDVRDSGSCRRESRWVFKIKAPVWITGPFLGCAPSNDVFSLAKVTIEMLTGMQVSEFLPNAAVDCAANCAEDLGS